MATCKECLHWKVCNEYRGAFWGHKAQYSSPIINASADSCIFYKDRSRFVELPCKVGDTVYEIVERKVSGKWTPKIVSRVVEQIEICDGGTIGFRCGTTIWISAASAFLTREEAEQALKERENVFS